MDDRDAILARRALLLSSALAAMSCSPPVQPTASSSAATKSTSSTQPTNPTASSTTSARAVPPLAPWSEIVAKLPPRGVPSSGVRNLEASQLRLLESRLDEHYRTLEEGWRAVPSCDPHDPSCRDAWRTVAATIKKLNDLTRAPITGGCGGLIGNTATTVARRDAHRRVVIELMGELEAHLSSVAASMGALGEQDWQRLLSHAKVVPPMPCLTPCMRPEVDDDESSLAFAFDSKTLADPLGVLKRIAERLKTQSTKLIVRGHASSDEAKPDELARARAQAVIDALVKAGAPKSQLVLESFGAEYPATREPEGNRRVDFAVEATSPRAP
jgi:outer membrane protein OmpA-like peptidoglycan-associated protein